MYCINVYEGPTVLTPLRGGIATVGLLFDTIGPFDDEEKAFILAREMEAALSIITMVVEMQPVDDAADFLATLKIKRAAAAKASSVTAEEKKEKPQGGQSGDAN